MHTKYNIIEKPVKLFLTREEARLIHNVLNVVLEFRHLDEMEIYPDEIDEVNLKIVNAMHATKEVMK